LKADLKTQLGRELLDMMKAAFDNPAPVVGNVIDLGRPPTDFDREILALMKSHFTPIPYPTRRFRRSPLFRLSRRVTGRPPRRLALPA
jgi:hypothetical protein